MNKVYAGIDGGGTKTAISILDSDGKLLYRNTGGPSSLTNGSEFENATVSVLREAFAALREIYKTKIVFSVVAGYAGTNTEDYTLRFSNAFKKASLGYDIEPGSFKIISDAHLALDVYFQAGPGLLLVSGTGSICYGKNENGDVFYSGGFGYLIDDAGSGFWFGKQAVKAALLSGQGTGKKTILEEMTRSHFKISKTEELISEIYCPDHRTLISSASRLVFDAAEKGCAISQSIIEEGALALSELALQCNRLIGNSSSCVVLHGSVFKQDILVHHLKKRLGDTMNIYLSDKDIDLEAAGIIYYS